MMDHNTLTTWSTWIVMITGSTTLLLLSAGILLFVIYTAHWNTDRHLVDRVGPTDAERTGP